jgi:hypothetical protein
VDIQRVLQRFTEECRILIKETRDSYCITRISATIALAWPCRACTSRRGVRATLRMDKRRDGHGVMICDPPLLQMKGFIGSQDQRERDDCNDDFTDGAYQERSKPLLAEVAEIGTQTHSGKSKQKGPA